MADELTCEECGQGFTLAPAVQAKYPGWKPKRCMACSKKGGSRGRGARKTAGGKSETRSVSLSREEVLARYDGGPGEGIFTDGSCQGNPGPGGWGAVWVQNGEVADERHGYDPSTTNNRMELTAIIEGLSMVPADAQTTLYTDSRLVADTLTKWAAGWEKRGWRRKDGEVKNLDLVQEAFALTKKRPGVHIEWIRAHDGSRWNEYADALSTAHLRDAASF